MKAFIIYSPGVSCSKCGQPMIPPKTGWNRICPMCEHTAAFDAAVQRMLKGGAQ